jgi:hypothetical protein
MILPGTLVQYAYTFNVIVRREAATTLRDKLKPQSSTAATMIAPTVTLPPNYPPSMVQRINNLMSKLKEYEVLLAAQLFELTPAEKDQATFTKIELCESGYQIKLSGCNYWHDEKTDARMTDRKIFKGDEITKQSFPWIKSVEFDHETATFTVIIDTKEALKRSVTT